MTRKRFIKLCMGQLGYSRNVANVLAQMAVERGSYEETYNTLSLIPKVTEAWSKALQKAKEMIRTTVKEITSRLDALADTYNRAVRCINDE